jgi:hypothetical protein
VFETVALKCPLIQKHNFKTNLKHFPQTFLGTVKSFFALTIKLEIFQDQVSQELIKSGCFSIKEHYQTELSKIRSELEPSLAQGPEPLTLKPNVGRPQRKFFLKNKN